MSMLRISGMFSGLDTDKIINDLVKAETESKVIPYQQDKTELEWKVEEYQNINKDIANFMLELKDEFGISSLSSTGVSITTSIDNFSMVKKATVSNTSIVSASARANALNGTFSVEVKQLAKSVSKISNEDLGVLKEDTLQTSFGDVFGADKILNFTINGKDFSFDTTVATLEDVVNEINSSDIGVIAYYDNNTGRMSISTEDTGSNYSIQITADEDNFLTGTDGSGNPTNLLKLHLELNTEYKGQDSLVLYGDDNVAFTSSDNTVSINGVDMTLLSTGTTTITISTNTDEIYNKIETFVNKYNDLIDKINKKLSEKYYRDYRPLTNEQKESLTDREIELWEEKARSGLLKDDLILKKMLSDMRKSLYEPVYDDYVNGTKSKVAYLFDLGITTKSYAEKGKLQIDETKLKQAIENDPEGVLNFFFKTPSDNVIKEDNELTPDEIKEKDAESGLINRLFNNAIRGMKEIINKAGVGGDIDLLKKVKSNIMVDFVSSYGSIPRLQKDISYISKKIYDNQIKINQYEDRLWKQYASLERALAEMQSRSSYFASTGGM